MIENELNKIIIDNQLNKINDNIYLTNYQINILNKHNIPYKDCNDLKQLIFILQDLIDEDEIEDILEQISEFDYYNKTNK